MPPPIANVSVTFPSGGMIDVLTSPNSPQQGRLTNATLTLQNPSTLISQDQSQSNGNLLVKGEVLIQFDFPLGAPCRPVGIAFTETGTQKVDVGGRRNLPKGRLVLSDDPQQAASILIHNRWTHHGKRGSVKWKFHLIVQDDSGAIGIIDPEIENTES